MSLLLALLVAVPLGQTLPVAAQPSTGDDPATATSKGPDFEPADVDAVLPASRVIKDDGPGLYLVRLQDPPAAVHDGEVTGQPATRAPQGERLDVERPEVRSYRAYLQAEQAVVQDRMARAFGRALDVRFEYTVVNNGFAVWMTPEEARRTLDMPGVVSVQPDQERELHTDNGPGWINAPSLWDGSAAPGEVEARGEGIVVGIIDTGIVPENPSFAATDDDGYVHTNPRGQYFGVCDPGHPEYDDEFPCNDKLIGAYGWDSGFNPDGHARDVDGHGSHVAGTVAGNVLHAATLDAPTIDIVRPISGVAPRANIISYSGCCDVSSLTAAIEQATVDAVDVINYSIGSTAPSALWDDFDTVGFLNARAAGIFVATSAGNSGPGAATVGSPGDAPWLTAVGASTHDREFVSSLVDLEGGDTAPPADIVGRAVAAGYGPAEIVDAGDFPNPNAPGTDPRQCLEPYPAGTFDGEIVVCERGAIARVAKGANVLAGGAGGMVLVNEPASGDSLNSDAHFLPAVHVTHSDGLVLLDWLASGEGHMATITGTAVVEDDDFGSIMAAFSSRGPSRAVDTITPHVTAPGVDILAAYGIDDSVEWNAISGTSMSSPHVAGAGALLVQLRDDWTPAEMQSALMTTASQDVRNHDGTDAPIFAMGSGHVDLSVAARAGLVLDETLTNYQNANPDEGGDPKSLNLPSMANSLCLVTCDWTRTVRGTVDGEVEWTVTTASDPGLTLDVSETSFILDADGATQDLVITADVEGAPTGEHLFGWVTLTPDDAEIPTARMPVAVVPTTGILPELVEADTRRDAGSQLVSDLQAIEIDDIRLDAHGLVKGEVVVDEVPQDPDNSNPFSHLDQVWWDTVEVPADAKRIVAEILDTTAPDLDLFVGTGETPSAASTVCSSTAPHSFERCDIADPGEGTWWILVQAWLASDTAPDPFTLSHAVVPDESSGNLDLDPSAQQIDELDPFDVRVFWDEPALQAGDRWYGAFSIGSDATSPGDVGTVALDLRRHDDDVTKTASLDQARPGDTVTFEITVEPNVTPVDLEYTLTDTIPDGMTYVEGSVTGGATVEDGVLTWTGVMETPVGAEADFSVTTNAENPLCDTPIGGWADLQSFEIDPDPDIDGGDATYLAFTDGAPFMFYGQSFQGIGLSPVGMVTMGPEHLEGAWWVPQTLPNPNEPNSVNAGLWGDFEVVYDAVAQSGVRLVSFDGTGPDGWAVVDFDRLERYGGSADTWSVQMWTRRTPSPFTYDIVIAYNDLGPLNNPANPITVGVENPAGTRGTAHVNNQLAEGLIDDTTIVCFNYEGPVLDPHVITYDVVIDGEAFGPLSNLVEHDVDNPGSWPETTSATVNVEPPLEFVPVAPCAVFDSRSGTGEWDGPLASGATRTAAVTGTVPASQGGADCEAPPEGAVAVSLNLVALSATGTGNLQLSAAGVAPEGGVVNFGPGTNNSNAVPVEVDGSGQVDVRNNSGAPIDVRGVVLGYYLPAGEEPPPTVEPLAFVPVAPCAVFDSRFGTGEWDGPLASGATRTAAVTGTVPASQGGADCEAPPEDAVAVSLNLVALSATGTGNLQLSAAGVAPEGGVVNFGPGINNSNAVPVEVDGSGQVDVRNNSGAPIDVRGVVLGYYVPAPGPTGP